MTPEQRAKVAMANTGVAGDDLEIKCIADQIQAAVESSWFDHVFGGHEHSDQCGYCSQIRAAVDGEREASIQAMRNALAGQEGDHGWSPGDVLEFLIAAIRART